LAERILDLLRDRESAATMAARAKQFVRSEFNLEITVARYVAVYENLVSCMTQHGDASDRESHFEPSPVQ
jgi:glycosyltransferase involved in cell wall biosynthesis